MSVLRELGEALPKNPTKLHVLLAVLKSRRKVRGMSDEALLRQPNMSDVDKLAVMQVLNVIFLNVYFTDPLLAPLVAVRMVTLSLDYGLSSISSAGFAFYGVLSYKCGGGTAFSFRCGQLALRLLEKFKCAEFVPRVYAPVYGFINSWKFEFSAALEPLKYAYDVGLATGDIEFAMVNASLFGVSVFFLPFDNAWLPGRLPWLDFFVSIWPSMRGSPWHTAKAKSLLSYKCWSRVIELGLSRRYDHCST
jgi:predicted ATPase